jgi:hypothetical protein
VIRKNRDARLLFPLPGGEGKGEGERYSISFFHETRITGHAATSGALRIADTTQMRRAPLMHKFHGR